MGNIRFRYSFHLTHFGMHVFVSSIVLHLLAKKKKRISNRFAKNEQIIQPRRRFG